MLELIPNINKEEDSLNNINLYLILFHCHHLRLQNHKNTVHHK